LAYFHQAATGQNFYQMVNFMRKQIFVPVFRAQISPADLGPFFWRWLSVYVGHQRRVLAHPPAKQRRQPEDGMSKHTPDADVAFIAALAELLNKNDLTELSVKREYAEDDSLEVRVVKQSNIVQMAAAAPAAVHYAQAPAAAAPAAAAPAAPEDPAQHPGALTSPMVGTCYMSAEPGAAPFVSVGSVVTEGQTVMIIEAMKTMNHIAAQRAGTVKRILVADGNSVEYGAPLMIIE
jgi:acetyl-CoA carboxylase biotin carboxyl carrier protein